MAFNSPFGTSASAPAPGVFGPFGTQTTNQQPVFNNASSFGITPPATTNPAPTFGNFGTGTAAAFGTPQAGVGLFGAPQQTSTPLFGAPAPAAGASIFGQASQPTTTGFGFGAAVTQPIQGFGTTTTTTAGTAFGTGQPSVFGFPQQASQPQASTGFGAVGQSTFGPATTTNTGFASTPGSFTFGAATATQQQQPSSGPTQQVPAFGVATQSTAFGATKPITFGTTQPPAFGTGTTTTQPTTSWFGGSQTSQPQTSTGFSGFGGGSSGGLFGQQPKPTFTFPTFGQPPQQQQPSMFPQPVAQPFQFQQQQQQQQVKQVDEQVAFYQSMFACCKFGDDRDSMLANLNYLQACWGGGKGFYNQSHPPVPYNDKNVFYRFKAVGYSCMYQDSNEDGQVVIHVRKPQSKVREEETQLISALQAMINRPSIFFKITGTKAVSEDATLVVLIADDRNSLRRILATDLAAALMQPQFKPQLDMLGVIDVCAKVRPSPEQLKAYLETPPAGMDARVWKKAQDDNPDPVNMIPIPLIGPSALKNRMDIQKKECHQHKERLMLIAEEVESLNNRHANVNAELAQVRRRVTMASHRVISAVVRLQMLQRMGTPFLVEEENLSKQFQELDKQINSPNQFRGRLNELKSHLRLYKSTVEARGLSKVSIDAATLEQARDVLKLQQDGIKHLVDTVKSDLEYIQEMSETVTEFQAKPPVAVPILKF